jgi:hypothetical protein
MTFAVTLTKPTIGSCSIVESRADSGQCSVLRRPRRARRDPNTRPRFRECDLRLRRALRRSSVQVMSGGNYDRNTKSLRATVFTQTDPLEADVGSAYPSAYVYGNNNPTMYVDPSGKRGMIVDTAYPVGHPLRNRTPWAWDGKRCIPGWHSNCFGPRAPWATTPLAAMAGQPPKLSKAALAAVVVVGGWPVQTGGNCRECAQWIQDKIGGRIVRVSGAYALGNETRYLGPSSADPGGLWSEHYAVVQDGKVFDARTGSGGQAASEFAADWEYSDSLRFNGNRFGEFYTSEVLPTASAKPEDER